MSGYSGFEIYWAIAFDNITDGKAHCPDAMTAMLADGFSETAARDFIAGIQAELAGIRKGA